MLDRIKRRMKMDKGRMIKVFLEYGDLIEEMKAVSGDEGIEFISRIVTTPVKVVINTDSCAWGKIIGSNIEVSFEWAIEVEGMLLTSCEEYDHSHISIYTDYKIVLN